MDEATAILTCPACGYRAEERMPDDRCVFFPRMQGLRDRVQAETR